MLDCPFLIAPHLCQRTVKRYHFYRVRTLASALPAKSSRSLHAHMMGHVATHLKREGVTICWESWENDVQVVVKLSDLKMLEPPLATSHDCASICTRWQPKSLLDQMDYRDSGFATQLYTLADLVLPALTSCLDGWQCQPAAKNQTP